MTEQNTILATFYKGWETYQGHLVKAVATLTLDQLGLRAAPNLRSIGQLASHIVGTRASWFYNAIGEGDAGVAAMAQWGWPDAPSQTADELEHGLEVTWRLIQDCLARWTPEEMAKPFDVQRRGQTRTFTRQWIIWHLIEHDLHHGGELAYSLGMHGLPAVDI